MNHMRKPLREFPNDTRKPYFYPIFILFLLDISITDLLWLHILPRRAAFLKEVGRCGTTR
jgi:hypothetical protein